MPITIPPFSNVPAPGDPIQSAWAQQLTTWATKLPRGKIDWKSGLTTDVAGIGSTPTDLSGMTVSWSAPASPDPPRLYLVVATVTVQQLTAAGNASLHVHNGTAIVQSSAMTLAVNDQATLTVLNIAAPAAGAAVTRKLQVSTSAGTLTYVGTFNRSGVLLVADIGLATGVPLLAELLEALADAPRAEQLPDEPERQPR